MVFEKRLKHEDLTHLEDAEYREIVRKDLGKRRAEAARSKNGSGEVMISIVLLIALATVVMHYFGIVQLPIK